MIKAGSMVRVGKKGFTVKEVIPSGKLLLNTGGIVPAGGVVEIPADIVARATFLHQARQDARNAQIDAMAAGFKRSLR